MRVELVYFRGCPNWRVADGRLRALASELGFEVTRRAVVGPEEVDAAGLRGSPTILVDGRDPFADPAPPTGMACRLYRTPDGPAGAPTVEQLRAALGG